MVSYKIGLIALSLYAPCPGRGDLDWTDNSAESRHLESKSKIFEPKNVIRPGTTVQWMEN